jgi:Fibronectin type III-like domain
MTEMEWNVGPGRSYKYFTGEPVFPFGFGMALTTFSIQNTSTFKTPFITSDLESTAPVSINVTNTGTVTGDEVVFLYAWPPTDRAKFVANGALPLKKTLLDYTRVHLTPGQSTIVTFNVGARAFALVERPSADTVIEAGTWKLELTTGNPNVASINMNVNIEGERVIVEKFPLWNA